MAKKVDSDALGLVNRALGLSGAGAPLTEFLDGTIDQVLDVGALVRRGRTFLGTGGIYWGTLRCIHGGAGTLTSTIEPYIVATGGRAPYATPVPLGFDIWILAAQVDQVSGAGTFTGALFTTTNGLVGWGVDDMGAAIEVSNSVPLALFDSVVTESREFGINEAGNPFIKIGMRMPRPAGNASVLTFSSTASDVATFDCYVLTGLFPIGMGQDILI